MKKIFLVSMVLVAVLFSSCANLLVSVPKGGQASEEQLDESIRQLEARVNGLYATMTDLGSYMGAQKYIDVYSDILASDVALPSPLWGFLYAAEQLRGYSSTDGFNSFVWQYNYILIRNVNLLIGKCNTILNSDVSDEIKARANRAISHAYAMRGYAYYTLTNYYTNPADLTQAILPYYDENNMHEAQPLSSYATVVNNAIADLDRAIAMLDIYSTRSSEQRSIMDADVAKVIQAYLRMNKGMVFDVANQTADVTEALRLAEEVIATGKYPILPYENVLTNGFNSVIKSNNWMWAVDVIPETSRMINSFWSLVDVFTYGYAAAGEYLALDDSVYNNFDAMLTSTDIRKRWWRDTSSFVKAPINKFFDAGRVLNADKKWTNDLVFMRIEEVYLLAAEAAFALNDENKARTYIKALVQERDTTAATSTMIDGLTGTGLKNYIANNWRIEMWMEGKSFMGIRRMGWTHVRGQNHIRSTRGTEITPTSPIFVFATPYSEVQTNPNIKPQ